MSQVVLIVDDDPVQRRLLEAMVQRFGYEAVLAEGGDPAVTVLTAPTALRIVQTAHGGIDNAVAAMRAGATDFVIKPASPERLQVSLRNALTTKVLTGELQRIKRSRDGTLSITDIITRSAAMRPVLHAAEKAAGSAIPVLVEGESGVGKELIARAIHGSGARSAKPFVAVNCGAMPENLVESILFGHEKGSFTGATEKHAGKFVEADGGTLFLDEVGELPPAAQVKLLRALQEGEVEPVGGRKNIKVDVRIVSATNRDLIADVKAGRFREDLFYRLHVFPIMIPPLRQRLEDIPELTRHFLLRIAAEEGKRVRSIGAQALALLSSYRWPGNVRQLENAVFRAVVLADGEVIGVEEFPQIAAQLAPDADQPQTAAEQWIEKSPAMAASWPGAAEHPGMPASNAGALTPPSLPLTDVNGDVRPLEEIERDVIRFAIAHYSEQMSEVARRLKIGRSTLYRKLDGLGLNDNAESNTVNEPASAE
jgi:DNA-binding NtrC family response regulator